MAGHRQRFAFHHLDRLEDPIANRESMIEDRHACLVPIDERALTIDAQPYAHQEPAHVADDARTGTGAAAT